MNYLGPQGIYEPMGCDGGSIPKRREMVKNKKIEDKKEENLDWGLCALSKDQLSRPIVGCSKGKLYNKTAVIEYLLRKVEVDEFKHIKSLKSVKTLNLTDNPNFKADQNAAFICPVSRKELNGKVSFVFLKPCGCVFSKIALEQVPSLRCLSCGKEILKSIDIR